ncbi:MAG: helix-turn-helix domain-containing protein [Alphaproteobacteria bacterium]|nr:helix-turn-helix domain-containing protein [Alphaproteobacteria bacterium]MBP9776238.1 helix-turn-helix domain-containing protein [Alphaproteobacteria bacterium]
MSALLNLAGEKILVKRLLSEGESIKSISKTMKTHPSTIYRNLKT